MKRQLDICLDLETLSTKPNAAIIQIAAKSFCVTEDDGSETFIHDSAEMFEAYVDFTDIVLSYPYLDIDTETRLWWKEKQSSAAAQFRQFNHTAFPLRSALADLCLFLLGKKKYYHADEIILWCQGKDFDIPILLNAMRECGIKPPFNPKKARCSRDFLFWSAELMAGKRGANPYSMISTYVGDGGMPHDAEYDVKQTIHNIIQMKLRLSETLKQRYNSNEDSNQQ